MPFNDSNVNYLVVADYHQQNIYQLQPDTGELRSLFTNRIHCVALALDPEHRIVYLAYVEGDYYSRRYRIRKRSFDGNVNFIIYYAPTGTAVEYVASNSAPVTFSSNVTSIRPWSIKP